ncbi:unnamed protein product [Danaus chrysippus]|uniref:(African queen) hypothetical protein n=1 Tax=Danaus chrysippus TaxID=151541 RepID=A0A8J2RBG1_9NEOP|nr:unnamed protein product [Danaus chrysippus]
MIPTCIRAPRSIQGSTDDVTRQTRSIVQIYTDWANHYLERARSRRRVGTSGGGLARDCADGLLLADVLEGVTGLKVPRAHRKPRNPQQMSYLISVAHGYVYGIGSPQTRILLCTALLPARVVFEKVLIRFIDSLNIGR